VKYSAFDLIRRSPVDDATTGRRKGRRGVSTRARAGAVAVAMLATVVTALAQAPSPPTDVRLLSRTADTVPPTVTTTTPAGGATGVATSTNITATFSEPMKASTLTTLTVTLTAQGSTTPVAATVSYDAATRVVTLDPTSVLANNMLYTATIKGGSKGVEDLARITLAADKKWTFTTASSSLTPPPAATPIFPGDNIQSIVSAAPAGTAFVIKAGVHRMQAVTPRNGQTFTGENGAIMTGARVLTAFSPYGSAWVASGQTQQGAVTGSAANGCRTTAPRCAYPEDLFINNVPLQHVASLSAGGSGKWYFDYAADQIHLWDDPTGKTVETSLMPKAFDGTATGVIIRNLVIEKYAAPTDISAVHLGSGWVIEDSEVRFNHFAGIGTGPGSTARRNRIHHNGGYGLIGAGGGIVVEKNEISYNNYAGYNPFWGAGGSKWVYTEGLIVRENFSHHNDGPGLWTDINNNNTLYENNTVEDNTRGGIMHEISYAAVIRNNILRRNGTGRDYPNWTTGAGVEVVNSSNVEVYGNRLEDNWQGITGLDDGHSDPSVENHGPWDLVNFYVHDNTVIQATNLGAGTGRTGVFISANGTFTSPNNRYQNNTYYLGTNARYFFWLGTDRTETEWLSYGQDTTGTINR
jgi:parallel beta-helix repeat protein